MDRLEEGKKLEEEEEVGNGRRAKISWHAVWDTSHQLIYWYHGRTKTHTHRQHKHGSQTHTQLTEEPLWVLWQTLNTLQYKIVGRQLWTKLLLLWGLNDAPVPNLRAETSHRVRRLHFRGASIAVYFVFTSGTGRGKPHLSLKISFCWRFKPEGSWLAIKLMQRQKYLFGIKEDFVLSASPLDLCGVTSSDLDSSSLLSRMAKKNCPF